MGIVGFGCSGQVNDDLDAFMSHLEQFPDQLDAPWQTQGRDNILP